MSHFYGTLQGARGEATRCGTPSSGIVTHAAGWHGAIRVDVFAEDGEDRYRVTLVPWKGRTLVPWKGRGDRGRVLAEGALQAPVEVR